MKKTSLSLLFASLVFCFSQVQAAVIDTSTQGYYNEGIGTLLNDSDPFFTGDPSLSISTAPDISAAATQLGGWLSNPPNLLTSGSTWSAMPAPIPTYWADGTETAVIYPFGSSDTRYTDAHLTIGVDNGILVWLDGVFIHGNTDAGAAYFNEYGYDLGELSAGTHYLQFLRVGQGGPENWDIELTGTPTIVPEPVGLLLYGAGLLVFMIRHRRKIPGTEQ